MIKISRLIYGSLNIRHVFEVSDFIYHSLKQLTITVVMLSLMPNRLVVISGIREKIMLTLYDYIREHLRSTPVFWWGLCCSSF
jgi:hypothetical protein